jgi:hypothetical protein
LFTVPRVVWLQDGPYFPAVSRCPPELGAKLPEITHTAKVFSRLRKTIGAVNKNV